MRILVTGGAGFIGSHVAELALERGHEVAALDNLSAGSRDNLPKGVRLYEVDVRDAEATRTAIADFRPDAVSHQAAQASVAVSMREPALDAAVNVVGGLHVAEACLRSGTERLVFASTGGAIYGEVPCGAAREDAPKEPISPYAINKWAFERLLQVFQGRGLSTWALRYANIYGPRQNPHGEAGVVAIFFDRARKGQAPCINGQQEQGDEGCLRDYVFVSDVARANLAALEGTLHSRILNIGTGTPTSTRTLAEEILSLVGLGQRRLSFGPPRPGDVRRSVLDGSVYRREIGNFTNLAAGLSRTAAWYSGQKD